MPSIKPKINPIDNQKQQSFTTAPVNVMPVSPNVTPGPSDAFTPAPVNVTLIPPNITSGLANTFGLTSSIYQLTITSHPANTLGSTHPIR